MKKIITFLFTIISINIASAQGNFDVGDNIVSGGIGFGGGYGGIAYNSVSPVINLQFEHGIWSVPGPGVVSLGAFIGFQSAKYESYYLYNYGYKYNYTIVGVRGAYHYNGIKSDKFDIYAGPMVSYIIVSVKNTVNNPYYDPTYNAFGSGLYFSGFVGGRYYVSPNFGLFGELGSGIAFLNIGISLKF